MRAQMTGELVETIDGSAELAVAGRAGERIQRLGAIDADSRAPGSPGRPRLLRWPPVWAQR